MVKCTKNSLFQEINKFAMYNVLFTEMCQNYCYLNGIQYIQMCHTLFKWKKTKFCNTQLLQNFGGFMKLSLSNSRNKKGGLLSNLNCLFIKVVNFNETNMKLQDIN